MKSCKHCHIPVQLLEFQSGERLWHHTPVIAVHDEAGHIHDIAGAYFYCSSVRQSIDTRKGMSTAGHAVSAPSWT